MQDLMQMDVFIKDAELTLTKMVRERNSMDRDGPRQEGFNPCIQRCKEYISAHIHEHISVTELAREMLMNASYLSELFKKYEGIPLSQFIMNEKIALTKNLLTYSNFTYIEIAAYLGVSSQSHLGKHFKTATGMTLRAYRNRYGRQGTS